MDWIFVLIAFATLWFTFRPRDTQFVSRRTARIIVSKHYAGAVMMRFGKGDWIALLPKEDCDLVLSTFAARQPDGIIRGRFNREALVRFMQRATFNFKAKSDVFPSVVRRVRRVPVLGRATSRLYLWLRYF